jgi:hypothetical protein
MSKEEREARDMEQMPKRRRVSEDEVDIPKRKDITKALTGDEKFEFFPLISRFISNRGYS